MDAAQNYLETLKSQIAEIDVQINPLLEKRKSKAKLANAAAADAGLPTPFPDVDSSTPAIPVPPSVETIAPDHYTGKKMATAVREIMQRRKTRGLSAISLEDLYIQLKAGGYPFRAQGKDNCITSLSTTLGKNIQFRRVPGNSSLWGLSDWYGGPARRKSNGKDAESGADDEGDGSEEEVPPAEKIPAVTQPAEVL